MKEMRLVLLIAILQFFVSSLFSQHIGDTLHVAHYTVNLSVLDFTNRQISGNTALKVVPKIENLTAVKLDLAAFTVDSVKINNQTASFNRLTNSVDCSLPNSYQLGDTLDVELFYQGVPERDQRWGGFYFSGEYAYNMGVAMTRIPHNYGRCWFPCLDVFTDKSTYDFYITTPAGKKAICSGVLVDSAKLENGNVVWHWCLNQPIPTYLASFAVGEYARYSDVYAGIERNVPIDIYVPQNRLDYVAGSFENLKAILRYFETSFGAYKFDRIGYVGVNFASGAMEHATNIAYPNVAVNGNLANESLWVHELSHSWFGNLITCEKAEEMWINEGFARYAEILAEEYLYDTDTLPTKAQMTYRTLHRAVLKEGHTQDGGYYALNAVPQSTTYGSTSYDKGALIVHNLRHYLGTQQFYTLMTQMLEEYTFDNISSEEFFRFLTEKSGLPMDDFFNAWVAQPGFLHFHIDSITPTGNANEYVVAIKQKLHHADYVGDNQRIDLTFFSAEQVEYTVTATVSGEADQVTVQIPFQPVFGIIDFYEKMSDALVDYQEELTATGVKNFADGSAQVNVKRITDPAFFRLEHHLVQPDALKTENANIYKISNNHFWRVLYFSSDDFEPELQFRFSRIGAYGFDAELFQGEYDIENLVLLYRKDATQDWRIVPSSRSGSSSYSGYLIPENPAQGEYCLAMGDPAVGVRNYKGKNIFIKPNPVDNYIEYNLILDDPVNYVEVIDISGKIIFRKNISNNSGMLDLNGLSSGNYVMVFGNAKDRISTKIVVR
ncbi:T9SS type A sorting domain-containing protein [Bacteroidales bacterium OttesenSCG-928-B11]|nr:T9SS type A sorting domain-containing protein [Bacteroidales bacterium OttesenSCG-928-C03]MDL2312765.1 T9SS type A sorting domain-containing protein [Bacteroidales bacterium OttesenSCG-928-B11]